MRIGPHTYKLNFADRFNDFSSGRRTAFHLIVGVDEPIKVDDQIVMLAHSQALLNTVIYRVDTILEMYLQSMPDSDLPLFGRDDDDATVEDYREAWDKLHPLHPWESNPLVWRVVVRRAEH